MPFVGLDDSTTIGVNDLLTTTAPVAGYDYLDTDAAQLQIWNGTGYDKYYYINDAGDNMNETGWSDLSGSVSTAKYAPGTGYWFKSPKANASFTLAGQVSSVSTITKDVADNKFELIGNPFPTTFYLSNLTTTIAPVSYDVLDTDALQLQVWNGTGYDKYYYINDAGDNMNETGWSDLSGDVITSAAADPTKGMWIKSPKGAGTITFAK